MRTAFLLLLLLLPALAGYAWGFRHGRADLTRSLPERTRRPAGVEALWQALEQGAAGPERSARLSAAAQGLSAAERDHPEVRWLLAATLGASQDVEEPGPDAPDPAALWWRRRLQALPAGPERTRLLQAFARRWPESWVLAQQGDA